MTWPRAGPDRPARANRFRTKDLFAEAITGLAGRPARLTLTALVVVLGIGSLVATIGLAQTGARQLQARFDQVAATHGLVRVAMDPKSHLPMNTLPWDASERATRLNGVTAAGTLTRIEDASLRIQASPVFDPTAPPGRQPVVSAVSPGLLKAISGSLQEGTWLDPFHEMRGELVAVLGARAADLLGVSRIDNQPAVFINGTSYTIIGILDRTERAVDLLDAVIVPQSTARATLGVDQPGEMHVR